MMHSFTPILLPVEYIQTNQVKQIILIHISFKPENILSVCVTGNV